MIWTITEKARAMRIDSQAPIQFWGEAINTAVYLHQRSPNEGLTKRDDRDDYKAPYETPYEMLHAFGKPAGNKISYKAPTHHLRRFSCYVSKLIPEAQRRSKFGPRSKPCMMVGYTHDSTTLWRIWDPNFQVVRAQSEVIFDEERNAYVSSTTDGIDIFGLPENAEYIEELHTGDGLLDGRPKDISGTGKGHSGGDHGHTDDVTDVHCHVPDDHTRRSLPARTASRSYPPDEGDTIFLAHRRGHSTREPPVSRRHIEHSGRLRRENHTARRKAAAMTKKSTGPPPSTTRRVTRSQAKASAEALMASALASTTINGDPSTYAEAMAGPLRDHWKRAIDEESASILLNNTFTTVNSKEAKQLLVKPVGSRWVFKTKRNPDGSTRYKAHLVIKGYEQTDFGETYAPVGKLTTFRYLISLVGRCGWNIDHLDVVTAFLNLDVDDVDIYVVLPEGCPEGNEDTRTYAHAPPIIVRLRKALYGLKQAPRLWHNDINTFLLFLGFTQSQADPTLYIRSDGILILL